jgi:sugar phosphate isomerase/epimerase
VKVLADPARAGVFHLGPDARAAARAAASAGLLVAYVDIGHAHDKDHFAEHVAEAMRFPESSGVDWDAFSRGLKDLSWLQAKGWVVILEKSKHLCAGHRHEFEDAMRAMAGAAEHWRGRGKPFWTLIGGPEGWKSGWPEIPAG